MTFGGSHKDCEGFSWEWRERWNGTRGSTRFVKLVSRLSLSVDDVCIFQGQLDLEVRVIYEDLGTGSLFMTRGVLNFFLRFAFWDALLICHKFVKNQYYQIKSP